MNKARLVKIVSIGVLLASIGGIFLVAKQRLALTKEVAKSSLQIKQEKSKYKEKYKKVNEQAFKEAYKSSNPALKTVAVQNLSYSKVTQAANSFFKIYYTYSNSKTYMQRADKLGNLITPELKKDKKLFGEVKDATGGNYIDSSGLHSEFESCEAYFTQNSGSNVEALVKVVNSGWYEDGNKSSDGIGHATNYYALSYNLNTNKISSLKLVFTEGSDSDGD